MTKVARHHDNDFTGTLTAATSLPREAPPAETVRVVEDGFRRAAATKRRDAEMLTLREVIFRPVKAGDLGGRRHDTSGDDSTLGITAESLDDFCERTIKRQDTFSDHIFGKGN